MEHHRCFKIYNKATQTERIADTLFFKHKYLTSPSVTPEDAVVAAAQQLAQTIGANSKGENKAMAASQEAATLFENIAQENKENTKSPSSNNSSNNSTTHQSVPIPRVLTRAQKEKPDPRLVVACPKEAVVASKRHPLLIPNYSFREQTEVPAHNT